MKTGQGGDEIIRVVWVVMTLVGLGNPLEGGLSAAEVSAVDRGPFLEPLIGEFLPEAPLEAEGIPGDVELVPPATLADLTYVIVGDTVTITDCDQAATGELVIPDTIEGKTVTAIGSVAFSNCRLLTDITIPATVVEIGTFAFYSCRSLQRITVPSGVTRIEPSTFSWCTAIKEISLPAGVTYIGSSAFYNCNVLPEITIPSAVTLIEHSAFAWSRSLSSVTIPANVSQIGSEAFAYCHSLTSIDVAGGNSHFVSVDGVLYNQTQSILKIYPGGKPGAFVIAPTVTEIGDGAFLNCIYLTNVSIPSSVTSIGHLAFSRCLSLTRIAIPAGVTSIGLSAFNGCENLVRVSIPDSVTSIDYRAFYFCVSLWQLGLPANVTTIGQEAFHSCRSLPMMTIPASVSSVGSGAFVGCSDLDGIGVEGGNTGYVSVSGVLHNQDQTTLVAYPGRRSGAYAIGPTVITLVAHAFSECSGLTEVTIPASVTSIEFAAFRDCSNLTKITFEGNAPGTLGGSAFSGVASNATVCVSSSATGFGDVFGGLPVVRAAPGAGL